MEYKVIFDVAQTGYEHWWFPAVGLVPVTIALTTLLLKWKAWMKVSLIWLSFGSLWTVLAFIPTYSDYLQLSSDLRDGRCSVIEGVVTDLRPMPPGPPAGYKADWFTVGGVNFRILRHTVSAGFRLKQSNESSLKEGHRVRIYYVRGAIARLEIENWAQRLGARR